jgi:molybdate transport system substrate-binding protein
MRSIGLAAVLAMSLASAARAADVSILVPAVVSYAGLKDLAAAATKDTGVNVTLSMVSMTTILQRAQTSVPAADLVALPSDLMDQLEHDHGIVPGSRRRIGRVEIDLAVPVGAPHPDISTPDKLVAVLTGAKGVAYDDPAGGTLLAWIIQSMLLRPEFKTVHTVTGHGDPLAEMAAGEADVALKFADEIARYPTAADVGPLPPVFGAHVDCDIAVLARSADSKAAAKMIDYLLRPAATPVWDANRLSRRD